MTDLPIACTLTPYALAARRAGLLADLLQRAEGREDLPEGLRLRFAPTGETLATIARAAKPSVTAAAFFASELPSNPTVVQSYWNSLGLPERGSSWRIARSVTTNLAIFTLAAFFEIAGCFAFWMWLRRGVTPFIALLGIASLIGFAVALTRVDSAFAGRAYAA